MIERSENNEEVDSPVRFIRELLGWSQQEMAWHLKVSITTISRWENGRTVPTFTIGQVKTLVKALEPHGLSLENLPDEMTPGNRLIIKNAGS